MNKGSKRSSGGGKRRGDGFKKRGALKIENDDGGNKIYTCHVLGCGKIF
jgi:hypothetical protein